MSHPFAPDPRQWQPPLVPPPAPKKTRKWPWVVGGIALLLVLAGVASGGSEPKTQNRPGMPSGAVAGPRVETWSSPGEGQPYSVEAASPSGPLTEFDDGTYEVGAGDGQVAPGRYKSPGSSMCYWSRLKNGDGELGDIIDNNVGSGQMILTVKATDGFVEIRGCTFSKAGA
jgi:hypothetical protein